MTIEDRVTKLEKAVFNSVVGKLVVNKEGKMEKELLKNGYTEKQILDMQKGMINFITDGGKKPLDIPVIPVVSIDDYYDEHCDKYTCFNDWKNDAKKMGYDTPIVIAIWNDHGWERISAPDAEHIDQEEADVLISHQQGYDEKQRMYEQFYDYTSPSFCKVASPEQFLLMAKWWIEKNVPLHDHEKDHGERKHWRYEGHYDEFCPAHLARFDYEKFITSEMYDPRIGLPFLAFDVKWDSFNKFKEWFREEYKNPLLDNQNHGVYWTKETDALIVAWDQAWEDKKAYWTWKPAEYDELKESLLGETTQIEKNNLARIQRIHYENGYWYRKREFEDGSLDHVDDICLDKSKNKIGFTVMEIGKLDVPNSSCRGTEMGKLEFNFEEDYAESQACHMEVEFGLWCYGESKFPDGSYGWYHQTNNRDGRPTDHGSRSDGCCTRNESQEYRNACVWNKHCQKCLDASAKHNRMINKMIGNDAWWNEQIKIDYENCQRFENEYETFGKKQPKWNKRGHMFLKKDACETCNSGEKDWQKMTTHDACYKSWNELTKKEQENCNWFNRSGQDGQCIDLIYEYEQIEENLKNAGYTGSDILPSNYQRYIIRKVIGTKNDVQSIPTLVGTDDAIMAEIYAYHLDGYVVDTDSITCPNCDHKFRLRL